MTSFKDKLKSVVNQVQQKVTEIQKDEKIKEAIQQAQQKITELQNDEKVKETINKVQEYQNSTRQKISEHRLNREKDKFEKASNFESENKFHEAVNILQTIKQDSSLYEEAQQKIAEYINASSVYVFQDAIVNARKGYLNEAIKSLKTIGEHMQTYQQAQEKIKEFEEAIKKEIANYTQLVPIVYNDRLIAAALLDETLHLVTSVERKKYFYSSLGNTYPDGIFLIIRLIVRNDGKKTRTISTSMMTLIDSKECEYNTSSTGSTALTMTGDNTVEILLTEIQPGLQKSISIVFDIPPTATDLKLKIPSGVFRKPVILPLSLAL